ncbi:MAG TPA: hypothetical protein PKC28_10635 [Bdellovibrionales bacterium]|nr:hypothetical protein [Bdellovibrionales bacterium]
MPETEVKSKKLTRFLCQELLYEFVSGNLDHRRRDEVSDYLSTDRESQRELEKLRQGMAYAETLGEAKLDAETRQALETFEPVWQKRLRDLTLWSSKRGWRMLPYAFVMLAIVVGLFAFKPWKREVSNDITLAEQLKGEPDMLPATPSEPAEPPPAIVTHAPVVQAPAAEKQAANERAAAAETMNEPAHRPAPGGRGQLSRGDITVNDFANTWPQIRDKVIALGGKAAGSVEIGWLRRADQSYFHFSIPESNLAELEIFLRTFGRVQFSKEKHPRVMPEGQIRIILTVKDAVSNESPAETP